MYAALLTSLGKIPGARMIALGTQAHDDQHWYAKLLAGGADYAQVHAASETDPPFQRRTWKKANPSLDFMPALEVAIRAEAATAKTDAAQLPAFEAYRLNRPVPPVAESMLIDPRVWRDRCESEVEPDGQPIFGVDLGGTAAQSAVAAYWPNSGRLAALAAFPAIPTLKTREQRDAAPGVYQACERAGDLLIIGDHVVNVSELLAEAVSRFGRPAAIASDRWREGDLLDAMDAAGLRCDLELRGQGFKDGGADVREFQRAALDKKVSAGKSLLLRHAFSQSRVELDPAGNQKLTRRRSTSANDAAVAAVLAVAEGRRRGARPRRKWRYHGVAAG